MSSSDDESLVFYRDRPDWRDVTPIPCDDGPEPVVSIEYSEQFADVYDYIRGVIKTGEKSLRVLDLTEDAIRLNAANYTVWQLRRDVIEALNMVGLIHDNSSSINSAVEKEFNFCHQMIMNNQKNYQVWHHRKAMVIAVVGYDEITQEIASTNESALKRIFEDELELTKEVLTCDAKNYHAWQHRQWILSVFKDFSEEMEYINSLLTDDVRNNSAWNQRHYVFENLNDFSLDSLSNEVEQTFNYIKQAPSNESAWSYLRGVIKLNEEFEPKLQLNIVTRCRELTASEVQSIPMLGLFVEVVDSLLKNHVVSGDEAKAMYNEAVKLLKEAVENIDPIRQSYWEYMKNKFVAAHSQTFKDDDDGPSSTC